MNPLAPQSALATRLSTLGLLIAADGVFLWMFLATDPLEQLAAALRARQPAAADAAFAFAATWRHGMAGNAWIYLPGFFLTAAAIWLHGRQARGLFALGERILAAFSALGLALAASAPSASLVVREFAAATGADVGSLLPTPSWAGTLRGLYTLATWSVFVLACRAALVRRTFRPFGAVAVLTVGLVLVRPWTVNDFVGDWAAGVARGSVPALASLALIFVIAALLAVVERSSQPQPRELSLRARHTPRSDDEEHVADDRDEIEAG